MALLTERENRYRVALDVLMNNLGWTNPRMAKALNLSAETIRTRRQPGGVKLRPDQVEAHAEVLGVPVEVFDMTHDEVLRWLADNRPEQVFAASGWLYPNTPSGQHAA